MINFLLTEFKHFRTIIVSSLTSCSLDSLDASLSNSSDTNLYDDVPMNSPVKQKDNSANYSEIVLNLQTHESNHASASRSI